MIFDSNNLMTFMIVIALCIVYIASMIYIKLLCMEKRESQRVYWFAYCEGEKRNFVDKVRVSKFQYENYILFESLPVRDITSNTVWFVVNDDTRNAFTSWQF